MLGTIRGRCCRSTTIRVILALTISSAAAVALEAQENQGRKTGWYDEAELSLVSTDGNSQSDTFSLRNTLTRVWERAELKVTLGGLRAESTAVIRTAVGSSAADAQLVESSVSDVTAERYYFETRYDRQISERWFYYVAAGWDRNEPAGIKNRSSLAAGAGNVWFDRDEARFRTDYALTYTDQEDVVELPGSGGSFAGLRLSSDYWRQLTGTAEYGNKLTVDQNLDTSDDLRAVLVNSLAVRVSDSLALRLSHELQFDNQPSLIAIPVRTPDGTAVGEQLVIEADDVDSTLSLALVVSL